MKLLFENWREYLNEEEGEEEEMVPAVVTFDFDSTLALSPWDDEKVYIVTSRNKEMQDKEQRWYSQRPNAVGTDRPVKYIPDYQMPVWEFVKKEGLRVKDVIFTNGKLKAEAEDGLVELGSDIHYDDDPEENAAAEKAGIKTVISDPYGDYEDLK
jgi:hypothetical protein